MRIFNLRGAVTVLLVTLVSQLSFADTIFMDFMGNAGSGLLPGNENPAVVSGATGGEMGVGLSYDDVTNTLFMLFEFDGLTGGIDTDVASGIHLHDAGPVDPFSNNGGIVFNLNSGSDPNVTYNSALIADGAVSGMVSVDVLLTETQEAELLAGQYYVNIHSASFGGGELRGNLVRAIPEPTSCALIGLGVGFALVRRRRT